MADLKISDLTAASAVNETDNVELSQSVNNVLVSTKASILSIATKILSGINFNTLTTTSKNIIGAINEAAQSGGGGSLPDYSTTEHLLGRKWIDGKDIYEKTYNFNTTVEVSNDSWTDTTIDSTNIDKIISCDGIHEDGTCFGSVLADPTKSSHTIVALQANRNNSHESIKYITIQYTKSS